MTSLYISFFHSNFTKDNTMNGVSSSAIWEISLSKKTPIIYTSLLTLQLGLRRKTDFLLPSRVSQPRALWAPVCPNERSSNGLWRRETPFGEKGKKEEGADGPMLCVLYENCECKGTHWVRGLGLAKLSLLKTARAEINFAEGRLKFRKTQSLHNDLKKPQSKLFFFLFSLDDEKLVNGGPVLDFQMLLLMAFGGNLVVAVYVAVVALLL